MLSRLGWIALLMLCLGAWCAAADSASTLAKKARQAEKSGDAVKAYLLYSQAAALDPRNRSYWARSQALRTRALRQSNALPAAVALAKPPDLPDAPDSEEEDTPGVGTSITTLEVEESRRPLPPVELKPVPGTRNFDLRGDARALFTQVTRAFGLDIVFDVDYQAGAAVRFRLSDVDLRTALHALQSATSSFAVPLSPKLLMIYKDTQQKRTEAEPTMAVTLSLPNPITVQEAQEMARSVQQLMEIQRFAVDSSQRLVLLKDRVSKVRAAQAIYQRLLTHRSQVMIEVELIEMGKTHDLNYGMTLPTSTAMSFLGRTNTALTKGLRIIPDFMPGFTRFILMGGGLSTIALAIADAKAFASQTDNHATSLFRTQLRSLDSQAATVHIGDKYPIVTQQYQGGTVGISPLATPSTFTFEDLGLVIKVTPRIHDSQEVSLQIEAEYKVLGSGSYNGIPVIQNRKFASTVRLRAGEWAVLAGMVSTTEARSITGIPGLVNTPILSHLLASNTRSSQTGETLLVLKTQILDSPSSELPTATIYTGTEGRWNTLP
ncbi:MAG TPA: type II and III secretion system protein [Bryobacteraceae bacterium]|nr:type II and III secretion system protein [Bryobacteraceae bacterium]